MPDRSHRSALVQRAAHNIATAASDGVNCSVGQKTIGGVTRESRYVRLLRDRFPVPSNALIYFDGSGQSTI
jgi:hypothetical protein